MAQICPQKHSHNGILWSYADVKNEGEHASMYVVEQVAAMIIQVIVKDKIAAARSTPFLAKWPILQRARKLQVEEI
jgi:hypothetical protein